MTRSSRITGTGSALGQRQLTNADMVEMLAKRNIETSNDWIVERTGIRNRHYVQDGCLASDLAVQACVAAIDAAGCRITDIDLIVLATSTPDMVFPSTATIVQRKLAQIASDRGEMASTHNAPAFDVQAVCAGFIYAITVADALIKAGTSQRALVVGAEVFSRLLDFNDRTTCVLFGDGAGAVVLEACDMATPNSAGILATDIHADGSHTNMLCATGRIDSGAIVGSPFLHMDGQSVFKMAVNVLEGTARSVLEKAGKTEADIDWLVPHQANVRIIQSTARKLKLDMSRVVLTVAEHGNTSAASIPLALDQAVRDGRIQSGHTVLIEGVGGGFTWGSVLLRM